MSYVMTCDISYSLYDIDITDMNCFFKIYSTFNLELKYNLIVLIKHLFFIHNLCSISYGPYDILPRLHMDHIIWVI